MNRLETCLLLAAIPVGLIAAGYWLVAGLRTLSAAERLAAAMLTGLCALIWTVSVVNLALPIRGIWGWVCLLPLVAPLLRRSLRHALSADLAAVFCNRRGVAIVGSAVVFLVALLWPIFSRPDLVYYDGTSGHDGFFWIVGAEHLKRQNYLQPAVNNAVYPLYYSIDAIVGLKPWWGRMGAEGLLALISNLAGASPLKLYVAATAALFFPWVAAVFLVVRTYLLRRMPTWMALALVVLQPAFLFFHANGNLPNLLGALAGGAVVVATARAMDDAAGRTRWLLLLALGGHALMCCYPEMIPPIGLICVLLALRRGRAAGDGASLAPRRAIAGAGLAALALNPVTTVRAWSGLCNSLGAARHWEAAGSIFDTVPAGARAPAMLTLSNTFGRTLGETGGWLCGLVLVVAAGWTIGRARDRFGAMAMLAGGAATLGYTLATHFDYGWQKTVQFSGVFLAALLPCGMLGVFDGLRSATILRRGVGVAVGGGVLLVLAGATVANLYSVHTWSQRKFLTREWFAAREFSRKELHNVPVRVDAESFSRPFFYSMWAAYFLDESRIYYTGPRVNGGYLRPSVEKYPVEWIEPPGAVLTGARFELPGTVPVWDGQALSILRRDPGAHRVPKE